MAKNLLNFEAVKHDTNPDNYVTMFESYEPYLTAYGLTPDDLSDERKRQLENILIEAAKSAGGVAIVKVTDILREEAAKKGLPTGTQGTSENTEAQKRAQELAKAEAEAEAKKRQTKMFLIAGGIGLVILGLVATIVIRKRKHKVAKNK